MLILIKVIIEIVILIEIIIIILVSCIHFSGGKKYFNIIILHMQ